MSPKWMFWPKKKEIVTPAQVIALYHMDDDEEIYPQGSWGDFGTTFDGRIINSIPNTTGDLFVSDKTKVGTVENVDGDINRNAKFGRALRSPTSGGNAETSEEGVNAVNFGWNPFFVDFWLWPFGGGRDRVVALDGGGANETWRFTCERPDAGARFLIGDGTGFVAQAHSVLTFPNSEWAHLLFLRNDQMGLEIWINGQKSQITNSDTANFFIPPAVAGDKLRVFSSTYGFLDEVRIGIGNPTKTPTDPLYSVNGTSFTPPTQPYDYSYQYSIPNIQEWTSNDSYNS